MVAGLPGEKTAEPGTRSNRDKRDSEACSLQRAGKSRVDDTGKLFKFRLGHAGEGHDWLPSCDVAVRRLRFNVAYRRRVLEIRPAASASQDDSRRAR
jgi:hypothetical protein